MLNYANECTWKIPFYQKGFPQNQNTEFGMYIYGETDNLILSYSAVVNPNSARRRRWRNLRTSKPLEYIIKFQSVRLTIPMVFRSDSVPREGWFRNRDVFLVQSSTSCIIKLTDYIIGSKPGMWRNGNCPNLPHAEFTPWWKKIKNLRSDIIYSNEGFFKGRDDILRVNFLWWFDDQRHQT